jgi:hypothetical protein
MPGITSLYFILYINTQRLLFDFSYSCESTNTSFESLQEDNLDNLQYVSIQNLPRIALIQRGYCNWSEKIRVASNISAAHNLNMSAIILFDNDTHGQQIDVSVQPAGKVSGTPSYASQLPVERNVSAMQDNDIDGTIADTPPVFFVPNSYGKTLQSMITNATAPNAKQFWQITVLLSASWVNKDDNDGLAVSRGYLSYIIALAAIFLIALFAGVIFLRWWRVRQLREQMEYEAQVAAHAYNMQLRNRQAKPLPVDMVNALPITKYKADVIKNANCAICLEDYEEDVNEVRVLGCGHGFCVLCIDPWLTQKSTICPICKWDCLPPELREESSEDCASSSSTPDHVVVNTEPQPAPSHPVSSHQATAPIVASTTAISATNAPNHSYSHASSAASASSSSSSPSTSACKDKAPTNASEATLQTADNEKNQLEKNEPTDEKPTKDISRDDKKDEPSSNEKDQHASSS